jgi:hypothetical protein
MWISDLKIDHLVHHGVCLVPETFDALVSRSLCAVGTQAEEVVLRVLELVVLACRRWKMDEHAMLVVHAKNW